MTGDTWNKIGGAMVGPGLIGQPARVEQKRGPLGRHGDITGIRIEQGSHPSVSIGGDPHSLDEWDVWVNVPPDVSPSLAERLGSPASVTASEAAEAIGAAITPGPASVDLIIERDTEGSTGIANIDLPPGIEIRARAYRNPETGNPEARLQVTTPGGRHPFGVGRVVTMRTVD